MIHIFLNARNVLYCFHLYFVSILYSRGYFEYVLFIVLVIFLLQFILHASYPHLGGSKHINGKEPVLGTDTGSCFLSALCVDEYETPACCDTK
jgi:hypothetical protein